ncbi:MAG TPA: UDP-N-acetylmuramoyl-tripeptide--D-alanyl-D-alanine ligase [Anaerolineaceae bacterium]
MLSITDIFEALTGTRLVLPALAISEAVIDSRQVIPGAMFVALPGERTDGHQYVGEAFQRGANLALIQADVDVHSPVIDLRARVLPDDFNLPASPFCIRVDNTLKALQEIARFWRKRLNLRVIGITGSVGKSTTKELVAEVLSQRYRTLKSPGNLNNEIGLPLTILQLGFGYERAVVEMGFYVLGEISFLCEIAKPQVGILTNIGTVHAERAGSQEVIARGKAELVQALPPAPDGVAILNYDDERVRQMASLTQARVIYYGLSPQAHLWADEIEGLGLEGIRFRIHHQHESISIQVPLIGQHSVHTALRAVAAGLVEGLTWDQIVSGLQQGHSQLRLAAVRTHNGALILDDTYNASPESTLAALNLLAEMSGKRRIAVLGEMLELGPYELEGHEKVGVRAASVVDYLITVGSRAQIIHQAARSAGLSARRAAWVPDIVQATEALRQLMQEGDVILIKGSHGLRMDRMISELEALA